MLRATVESQAKALTDKKQPDQVQRLWDEVLGAVERLLLDTDVPSDIEGQAVLEDCLRHRLSALRTRWHAVPREYRRQVYPAYKQAKLYLFSKLRQAWSNNSDVANTVTKQTQ